MSDPERLQRVVTALAEAISAREEGKRVKLPVLQRADAAALTQVMHAQLDDAIAERDAYLGDRLACSKGCNACCRAAVVVAEGEAIAVAEWLRENPAARARFESAFPAWRAALGSLVETPETDDSWSADVRKRDVMCAFNHEGACTIYPVRPSLCRTTHALDTNQYCNVADDVRIPYFQHPPTEELYQEQRPMRFGIHASLRPSHRFELLCAAVHRLLGGAAAGRNEPCPCGSGKKFKKCCGGS